MRENTRKPAAHADKFTQSISSRYLSIHTSLVIQGHLTVHLWVAPPYTNTGHLFSLRAVIFKTVLDLPIDSFRFFHLVHFSDLRVLK